MSPASFPFFYILPEGLSRGQIETWATTMADWGVSVFFAGSRALFTSLDDVEGAVTMLADILAVAPSKIG